MFYLAIATFLFILFLAVEIILLAKFSKAKENEAERLKAKKLELEKEEILMKQEVEGLENKSADIFFFYDLTRKLAPALNKRELFDTFFEEMKHFGGIEEMQMPALELDKDKKIAPSYKGYLKIKAGKEKEDVVYIKTQSRKVKNYLAYFSKLLRLCIERINLYDRLQQLSIYDSLTEAYNRRYMMERFVDEFERAKKFNFNLSFLMLDIDHFKKINDTYGHLVGDAVLREIARLTRNSIREIDFIARVGGEEFSVILPETDKAGAVMVAERIRAAVSNHKIHAFDEIITTAISLGVASYPQNTLYADALMETADKALYKAKLSGRNRVSWF